MEIKRRKNPRLLGHDYSKFGTYFVTICTFNRRKILCELSGENAALTFIGEIVKSQIFAVQKRYEIIIDKYVIMPNHVHMLISIPKPKIAEDTSIAITDVGCTLKSITTKLANREDKTKGRKVWQRSFYDRIVRDEKEYLKIWEYIETNQLMWHEDRFFL